MGRDPVTPEDGLPYAFLCTDEEGWLVYEEYLLYEAADPFAGILAAERAAELAMERLDLPFPAVDLSPPAEQVVGIPTWLAVGGWSPAQVSASVAGVTSTVTAHPRSVAWDLGDGTSITCDGPGTAFDPSRSLDAQSSDCSHTYTWPSYPEPDGTYDVAATVTYDVSWSATNGASGDLGTVTRTSTTPVRVLEVQAVGR